MAHKPADPPLPKKRKRRRHGQDDDFPSVLSPMHDPQAALELLMDRLSVWQEVARLGLDVNSDPGKGKRKVEEYDLPWILRDFWDNVVVVQ